MALTTKCVFILFLVYLNFDISPLHSAVIPERLDSAHNVDGNDDNENYSTTAASEDDIEKIFETYENLYIKNSNWFNDGGQGKDTNDDKSFITKPDDESSDIDTTEPTTDDVVESIHNIMDEKIDAKKNRTDRTIVVVVTTNVFNINGSDDSSKRQHTLLSFGTPGMFHKETSTDATLAMHNKITTQFFNSNPSPIGAQLETVQTSDKEKSIADDTDQTEADTLDDSVNIFATAEEESSTDVATTETPIKQIDNEDIPEGSIDIRQLHDTANIPMSNLNSAFEGRSFDGELSNDASNDIVRIMKVIPNRSDEESNTGSLSKPFEIPIQEPQDSSLMEAMENILDTDVRKAFERDIPQTRHVPLDINIEEEALYAPLKDLSEYIVEEVPINGNYEPVRDDLRSDDKIELVKKSEVVELFGQKNELKSLLDYNRLSEATERVDQPVTEGERTTTTITTTEEPAKTTITEQASSTTVAETVKPKTADETTTTMRQAEAYEFESVVANEQIEDGGESKVSGSVTTTTLNDNTFEQPKTYETFRAETSDEARRTQKSELLAELESVLHDLIEREPATELLTETALGKPDNEDDLKRLEPLEQRQSFTDLDHPLHQTEETETQRKEESQIQEEIANIPIAMDVHDQQTTTLMDHQEPLLHIESETQPQHNSEDANDSQDETFEELVDRSLDEYPIYAHLDTTTEYHLTNPNLYIGALLTHEQVTAILEAGLANAGLIGETSSSVPVYVDVDNSFDNNPYPFTDTTPSNRETTAQSEDKLDESVREVELAKTFPQLSIQRFSYFDILRSKTTRRPHGDDVVSEVVKVDEETTEQHQIIKKPGVNETVNNDVALKSIKITNVVNNGLQVNETTYFESRSFSDINEPIDPLRTLVEGVELTADITKTVDNFQSVNNPNDAIHFAANQIIETGPDMALAEIGEALSTDDGSVWCSTARYIYISGGVLTIGLLVLLSVVSYLRFRQFKRNVLFTC